MKQQKWEIPPLQRNDNSQTKRDKERAVFA